MATSLSNAPATPSFPPFPSTSHPLISHPPRTTGGRSGGRKVQTWPTRAEELRPGVVRLCVCCTAFSVTCALDSL
jgi:hypothetical protein